MDIVSQNQRCLNAFKSLLEDRSSSERTDLEELVDQYGRLQILLSNLSPLFATVSTWSVGAPEALEPRIAEILQDLHEVLRSVHNEGGGCSPTRSGDDTSASSDDDETPSFELTLLDQIREMIDLLYRLVDAVRLDRCLATSLDPPETLPGIQSELIPAPLERLSAFRRRAAVSELQEDPLISKKPLKSALAGTSAKLSRSSSQTLSTQKTELLGLVQSIKTLLRTFEAPDNDFAANRCRSDFKAWLTTARVETSLHRSSSVVEIKASTEERRILRNIHQYLQLASQPQNASMSKLHATLVLKNLKKLLHEQAESQYIEQAKERQKRRLDAARAREEDAENRRLDAARDRERQTPQSPQRLRNSDRDAEKGDTDKGKGKGKGTVEIGARHRPTTYVYDRWSTFDSD